MKNLIRKIALISTIAASAVCITANADTAEPKVRLEKRIGEQKTDTVFVGETINTVMGVDDFDKVASIQLAVRYNKDVIALVDSNGNKVGNYKSSEIDKAQFYKQDGSSPYGIRIPYEIAKQKKVLPAVGENLPNIDTENGIIKMACVNNSESEFMGKNDYFYFTFKVENAGDLGIEFATESDTKPYDGSSPTGLIIGNTVDLERKDYTIENDVVIAKEKPETPSNLVLDDSYKADWDDQANRGYIVQLYKDGAAKGEEVEVSESEYDFSSLITEGGKYYFTVVAKGGTNNSETATSPEKNVEFKLDAPSGTPAWKGTELSWNAVDDATGYVIELYKDNKKVDEITVTGTTKDLAEIISANGIGIYTAKVKATAENYKDSDYSAISGEYSTGSVIKGYVGYDLGKMSGVSIRAAKSVIKVALYNGGNKYAEVNANDEGYFEFKNVENGTYYAEISAKSVGAVTRKTGEFTISGIQDKEILPQSKNAVLKLGDITGDTRINVADYNAILGVLGKTIQSGETEYDKVNIVTLGNGIESINSDDLLYVVQNIGFSSYEEELAVD